MIRVLIADDYEPMRRLVGEFLARTPDMELVGACGRSVEVVECLNQYTFDVVVISHRLLTPECLQLIRQFPLVKVIVTSLYQNKMVLEELLKLSASGLVLKPDFDPHLPLAIRAVHQNEMYFSVGN